MRRDAQVERQDRSSSSSSAPLARLSAMDDFEIVDGEPDIRGWDVRSMDGRKIGEVDDLLVDPGMMKVRYVEVKLEDELASDDDRRFTVLPIGSARLDDDEDEVIVNLRADDLRTLPPYDRGQLTRSEENSLMEHLASAGGVSTTQRETAGDFYGQSYFDDRRPFEGRRAKAGRNTDDARYLTRTEKRNTR